MIRFFDVAGKAAEIVLTGDHGVDLTEVRAMTDACLVKLPVDKRPSSGPWYLQVVDSKRPASAMGHPPRNPGMWGAWVERAFLDQTCIAS